MRKVKTNNIQIKNCCNVVTKKIDSSKLNKSTYVTAENMCADFSGITNALSIPNGKVTEFSIGNILISKIRPYLKKNYFAQINGGCSNDIICLEVQKGTFPKFVYYTLCADQFIKYFSTTSTGSKMPRGDLKILLNYTIPNLNYLVQQKIAKILTKWDDAIALQKQLIEKLEVQKSGLVKKLLTPQKGWATFEFNDIFQKFKYSQKSLQTKDYLEHGKFPIVDQGKQFITGFTNDSNNLIICPSEGLIIFGDHTLVIKYINFDFVLGGDGTQLLIGKKGQVTAFLYYLLDYNKLNSLGYSRHFSMLKEKTFDVPNISKQKEIVKILSKADKLIEIYSQKLDLLKCQRKALMQRLLTGAIRVKV